MKRVLLSIFSSEPPQQARSVIAILGWALFGFVGTLLAFEVCVAVLFPLPADARSKGNSLVRYFNYGLSIEAKLERTVGPKGQEANSIIRAGWVSTELYPATETWTAKSSRTIFYGMSFTNRIASAVGSINSELGILTRAGPGAALSHSYALFKADPDRTKANHIVVGILSSSIPYIQGMTGLGYTFESPAPYAFPKFSLVDGKFDEISPVIGTRDGFISAFRTKSPKFEEHLKKIVENDPYWDPFLYYKSWADRSALLRLIRRSWASSRVKETSANVYSAKQGYDTHQSSIAVVPEILYRMQRDANAAQQQLIVVLLHSRGEPGHLDKWLSSDLRAAGIKVVSSTDLFSSTDALNFEGDGHYLPERDQQLAEAIVVFLK